MRISDAEHVVKHLTYKPNTKIAWLGRSLSHDVVSILVRMHCEDVVYPPNKTLVARQLDIELFRLEHFEIPDLLRIIRHHIVELEMHEVDEWFCFYGDQVNEPHPELRTT